MLYLYVKGFNKTITIKRRILILKKNYRIKKTISMKQFISEFGESFSQHMKKRLLELEIRCVLTRKDDIYRLDIKHVEHIKHECTSESSSELCEKEYVYGQLVVLEGILYLSEKCIESETVAEAPIVSEIYNGLNSDSIISDGDMSLKKVDDTNIDYVIDTILTVCPQVSQKYLDIVKQMTSLSTR